MKEKDMKRRKAEKQVELSEKKVRMPMQSKKNKIKIKWLLFFPAMLYWICRFNYLVWCLRIAPLRSSSRNSTNVRNPLIYYVNRYFLMFGGSQVQKPYHASMNGFSTFWPWHHDTTFCLNVYYFFHFYARFSDCCVYLCIYSYYFYGFMHYGGIIFILFSAYFSFL